MDGRHADDDFVSKVNNSLEKALCNTLIFLRHISVIT